MKMHFDILFLDVTANKYYDRTTLERDSLGGTEATVIRLAEALGSLGLKVAVMQTRVNYFPPIMGQHAFFIHGDDAPSVTCNHYIQLRRNLHPEIFKGSKKYLWLHDVAVDEAKDAESLKANNIKVLGVSRWHKNNIKEVINDPNVDIDYIYNPIQDDIYVGIDANPQYNNHLMCWTASPHKGLENGLKIFKKIHEKEPRMQLIVFNPGYIRLNDVQVSEIPGVTVYGKCNVATVWSVVQKSLCVFYPTQWKETFGMIAAEANALGTPMITNPIAALKEVISSTNQFANTEEEFIDKVLDWSNTGRPRVFGKEEFKLGEITLEWVKLLGTR